MNTQPLPRDCPQGEPLPEFYDEPADYWRDRDLWEAAQERSVQ